MDEEEIEREACRIVRAERRERALKLAAHRSAAREAYWRAHPTIADATYRDYLARVGGADHAAVRLLDWVPDAPPGSCDEIDRDG